MSRSTRLTAIAVAVAFATLACSSSPGEPTATVASPTESLATPTVNQPAAPQNPGAGTPFDLNAVTVSWDYAFDPSVVIRVERATAEDGRWEFAGEVRGASTNRLFMDIGLCPGNRYWYRLFALRDDGVSEPSEVTSGVAGDVMPGLATP